MGLVVSGSDGWPEQAPPLRQGRPSHGSARGVARVGSAGAGVPPTLALRSSRRRATGRCAATRQGADASTRHRLILDPSLMTTVWVFLAVSELCLSKPLEAVLSVCEAGDADGERLVGRWMLGVCGETESRLAEIGRASGRERV